MLTVETADTLQFSPQMMVGGVFIARCYRKEVEGFNKYKPLSANQNLFINGKAAKRNNDLFTNFVITSTSFLTTDPEDYDGVSFLIGITNNYTLGTSYQDYLSLPIDEDGYFETEKFLLAALTQDSNVISQQSQLVLGDNVIRLDFPEGLKFNEDVDFSKLFKVPDGYPTSVEQFNQFVKSL